MPLLPLLFSHWWEDLTKPHSIVDQNFGLTLQPDKLWSPAIWDQQFCPTLDRTLRYPAVTYHRPWGELLRKVEGGGTSTIKSDKNQFQVILDVQQFKPDEITVKVVDKCVLVEGKHEEKEDEHGWISRQFVRKYIVPEQCDVEQVSSCLSSDGVLTISAPRKDKLDDQKERTIKIEHTGKPAIREAGEQKSVKNAEENQDEKSL